MIAVIAGRCRSTPAANRYDLDVPAYEGLPWMPPDVTLVVKYTAAGGVPSTSDTPVVWRYEGRSGGEKQKVVAAVVGGGK